jgi:acetyltransferase EpsM
MHTLERPLKIIGSGGHGRVIADIARSAGETSIGFVDDNYATAPPELNIEGPTRTLIARYIKSHRFVVAVGDRVQRRALASLILADGGDLATLIHPSAVIAPDVTIGEGTVVMAGVVINTGTRVGRFVIINTRASVDHDNLVEDNVQIAPGCTLAGTVVCRQDAFIGAGATIIQNVEIGEGACVAAGATVIRPVRARTLVAGCPAVEKREL